MSKKTKLKLEDISVQSFITSLNINEKYTLKGGTEDTGNDCQDIDDTTTDPGGTTGPISNPWCNTQHDPGCVSVSACPQETVCGHECPTEWQPDC